MVRLFFAIQWPFLASPCARPFCPWKHMLYHTKRSERYLLQKGILYYSYVKYLDADPQFFQLVANWYHTNAFCATKLRWLCILFMYTMNVSLLMVLVPLRLWYLPTKSVGWHSGVICKILWYMYMFMPYKYYWYYVSLLFECVLPM